MSTRTLKTLGAAPLALGLVLGLAATACSDASQPGACVVPSPPSGFPTEAGLLALEGKAPSPFAVAPHRAWEPLPSEGGAIDAAPQIVVVAAADDPLADTMTEFVRAAAQSSWWPGALGEYGVGRPTVFEARGGPMSGPIDEGALGNYVDAVLDAGNLPRPATNTIHLVFLSPDINWVDDEGQNCGCAAKGGAHMTWGDGQLAFVQRCSTDVDALTIAASHEIAEAATNPDGHGFIQEASDAPWTEAAWAAVQTGGDEAGDRCEGTRLHEGGWTYQRIWSNDAAARGGDPCAPALHDPYFTVSTSADWFSIPAGGSIDVELDGWSDAPRGDWFVYPAPAAPSAASFTASVSSDVSAAVHGTSFFGINDDKKATLHVQAPTQSGAWTVLRLYSRDGDPTAGDSYHFYPVGFHVE